MPKNTLYESAKHLFDRNIVNSPFCDCGMVEDNYHYFFRCPMYAAIRHDLISSISMLCTPTLDTILHGNDNIDERSNIAIFKAVHSFIRLSKRF